MSSTVTRVALVVLALLATALTAAQQIQVQIDGNPVYFPDTTPQRIDGRVMIPIRSVFEQTGGIVNWDDPRKPFPSPKTARTLSFTSATRTR